MLSDVDYGGGEEGLHGSFEVKPNRDRRLPQDDTIISQRRISGACLLPGIQGFRRGLCKFVDML